MQACKVWEGHGYGQDQCFEYLINDEQDLENNTLSDRESVKIFKGLNDWIVF